MRTTLATIAIIVGTLMLLAGLGGDPPFPTEQTFSYETGKWLWYDQIEVSQHPEVQRVSIELKTTGDWWFGVETLNPDEAHGRLTYKSTVHATTQGVHLADSTGIQLELNGPFDGILDFTGSSGSLGRDQNGAGATTSALLDPAPFKGHYKYLMPIAGFTEHLVDTQGNAMYLGLFQEGTRVEGTLRYEVD